jgi:hypothetical protein
MGIGVASCGDRACSGSRSGYNMMCGSGVAVVLRLAVICSSRRLFHNQVTAGRNHDQIAAMISAGRQRIDVCL